MAGGILEAYEENSGMKGFRKEGRPGSVSRTPSVLLPEPWADTKNGSTLGLL